MAGSPSELLTRIAVLIEQSIRDGEQIAARIEALALEATQLSQHGSQLADIVSRLENGAKQSVADQAELRALVEALRVNVRHDTADIMQKVTLSEYAQRQRLAVAGATRKEAEEEEIAGEAQQETALTTREGALTVRVPIKTALTWASIAVSTVSGWLWHYHKEIGQFFGAK